MEQENDVEDGEGVQELSVEEPCDSSLLTSLSVAIIHAFNDPLSSSSTSAFSHILPDCSCQHPSLQDSMSFTDYLPILIHKTKQAPRTTHVLNSTANVVGNKTAAVFSYVKILGNPDGMAREAMHVFKWRKIKSEWYCYQQTALRSAEGIQDGGAEDFAEKG